MIGTTGSWKHHKGNVHTLSKKMKVTLRIQNNWQNGQLITIVSDDNHPNLCPVSAAYQIFLRAKRLGQTDQEPMAVFLNKSGNKKYLTGNKISKVLRLIARAVHPNLFKDKHQVLLLTFRESLGPSPAGRGRYDPRLYEIKTRLVGQILSPLPLRHFRSSATTRQCPEQIIKGYD
jgi:hypothetical protein